jgi:hypothetical protein
MRVQKPMQRSVSSVGLWLALSSGASCLTACGDDAIVLGLPMGGSVGYEPVGRGGNAPVGRGGTAGSGGGSAAGGRGGTASGAGGAGGTDNGAGGAADGGTGGAPVPDDAGTGGTGVVVPACVVDNDCNDGNPCTTEHCDPTSGCVRGNAGIGVTCGSSAVTECNQADGCDGAGACRPNNVMAGVACGSATVNACTARDTCDGFGACGVNNALDGTACATGHCSTGVCDCASLRVTTVPFTGTWSTLAPTGAVNVFSGSCAGNQLDPDYVLVFTAPTTGNYTLDASGSSDSTLTVVTGACGSVEAACDDDVGPDEEPPNRSSQVALLPLVAGDVISVVVSEFGENAPARGSGTVSIVLVP